LTTFMIMGVAMSSPHAPGRAGLAALVLVASCAASSTAGTRMSSAATLSGGLTIQLAYAGTYDEMVKGHDTKSGQSWTQSVHYITMTRAHSAQALNYLRTLLARNGDAPDSIRQLAGTPLVAAPLDVPAELASPLASTAPRPASSGLPRSPAKPAITSVLFQGGPAKPIITVRGRTSARVPLPIRPRHRAISPCAPLRFAGTSATTTAPISTWRFLRTDGPRAATARACENSTVSA
jgi:hypothetical protein